MKIHIFHDWNKWEQISENWFHMDRKGFMGKPLPETRVDYQRRFQKRTCKICNKEQKEAIDE